MDIRERENKVLKAAAYLYSAVSFIWQCAPFLVSLLTFATYVLVDENNILNAKKAFVSLTLFNIMRMPLTILPQVVTTLVQTSVSLKRINKYMNSEDIDPKTVTNDKNKGI
jgi:ATP-binding cassette subfamily C (CFTR/MRP) protein 1